MDVRLNDWRFNPVIYEIADEDDFDDDDDDGSDSIADINLRRKRFIS
jgi:hypothetical protein